MKAITRYKFKTLQQIEDVLNQIRIGRATDFLIKKKIFIISYDSKVEIDREFTEQFLKAYKQKLEKEIKEEINEEGD